MNTPRYATREQGPSLPSICIGESNPRGIGAAGRPSLPSHFSPSFASIPMSIPSSQSHLDDVPPALPPPRVIPVNGEWNREAIAFGDRYSRDEEEDGPHYRRRNEDEGYHSLSSYGSKPSAKFGQLHDQFQFTSVGKSYDNSLLKKLDARRTLDNRSPPRRLSSSAQHAHSRSNVPSIQPLILPMRFKPMLDSPSRCTDTPVLQSAISPRSNPFGHSQTESGDFERSPIARTRRTYSESFPDDATVSTQGSAELNGDDGDLDMDETSRLRDFHIDASSARSGDYHAAGQKRRASSPPGEEPSLHSMPSNGLLRGREGAPRGSPTPRLSVIPQRSISSISTARSNSYTSNISMTATSMTSLSSFGQGRRSPGGLSTGGMSPTEPSACSSPYATPISLTASPRSSISRTPHHRTLSDQNRLVSPRKLTEIPKTGVSGKISGFYMCDCCPKKPKKFDTADELLAHEAEKQYECSFCGNRFKNKNEAERHQNSLHVRRHSWSCSALSGYDRAFHESTNRPGEADTCGYCGEEFPRSGHAPNRAVTRHATDQDWEDRIRHLQDIHKFRECNSSKKFYRADHFRQHLKHSHAGTSGKWTNMLENACMLEEDPPVPSR